MQSQLVPSTTPSLLQPASGNDNKLSLTNDTTRDSSGRVTIYDSCMPSQWHHIIHVPNVDKSIQFAYVRKGTGQYTKCVQDLLPLLDKGAPIYLLQF